MSQLRPTRASDLEGFDDGRLLQIVHSLPRDNSLRELACEVLVLRYQSLVQSCVVPFRNTPESQEELMQVGYVGLLKAIKNFDPAVGSTLAGYAQPCISGEIKRHFRDRRWHVRVKRSLQELRLELRTATGELTSKLGRAPTHDELAKHVRVPVADVQEAVRAEVAFRALSLDSPTVGEDGSATMADQLGDDDPRLEHLLDMQAVWTHWSELPGRLQQILLMRFYGNMTQAEIGQQLRISQMHVSRLLAEALGYLREHLTESTGSDRASA